MDSKVVILLMILMIIMGEYCKVNAGSKTCHTNDLKALKDFKAGIYYDDSFRLNKWTGHDCCKWEGISCHNITGRVIQVNLPGPLTIDDYPVQTSMKGQFSPSLCNLSSLEVLDLGGLSGLKGHIPPLIGNLKNLRALYLSMNKVNGPIPKSIGELSKLEELTLDDNKFSGSLPSTIGSLRSLKILNLQSNNFSGSIPDSIGNLMKLEYLQLQNNFLTGNIPENIGKLQELQDLALSNNLLTGKIPLSITNLKSITRISLSENHLTGSLPSPFGLLKSLNTLSLDNNQLEGPVPSSFGNLHALLELDLSGNRFSGKLPKTIGLLPLIMLDFSHNMIEGPLPLEMSSLKNLQRLYLSFNPLNLSSIPTWIVDLPSIYMIHLAGCGIHGEIPGYLETAARRWIELDLSANHLTGSIPPWFGTFQLYYLNLSVNSLVSKIPNSFTKLSSLRVLDLHSNGLSGSLTSVFQMDSSFGDGLSYVDLSDNSFSGDIEQIGNTTQQKFEHINLSRNFLSGKLPTSVGNLQSLSTLDLSYNQFNSVIPESLANAKYLVRLKLQNNQFWGKIPQKFLKLSYLKELNVSNNLLSGEIPFGKPLVDFPESSYSGNKGLCGKPLAPCRPPSRHP